MVKYETGLIIITLNTMTYMPGPNSTTKKNN